ncbi:hypothetical protein [Psychroflexus sp. MES1-P1E]|uniref:hypothetical protein n=1 Tax=Psychroflexus sp. MES1-P1E TaxID=2058320 RepID=UPI000C7A902E|nr:hypothetical protein [Psychroflexus sp. MES1-P1E]PKG42782.1 hypothetical protein CXF67_08460 [Psychroflexus sp. MES1-P1E]
MKENNLVEKAKDDLVKNIIDSKVVKVAKFTVVGFALVYGFGYFFKILAFTKSNFNDFRKTLKS